MPLINNLISSHPDDIKFPLIKPNSSLYFTQRWQKYSDYRIPFWPQPSLMIVKMLQGAISNLSFIPEGRSTL